MTPHVTLATTPAVIEQSILYRSLRIGLIEQHFPEKQAEFLALAMTRTVLTAHGAARCMTFRDPGPPWYGAQCRNHVAHAEPCDFGTEAEAAQRFFGSLTWRSNGR